MKCILISIKMSLREIESPTTENKQFEEGNADFFNTYNQK